MFPCPNITPIITPDEATAEMMWQNSERRVPPPVEFEAIQRLYNAVLDEKDRHDYGPDLAIKAFNDLDTVFFGGHLCGNVKVQWTSSIKNEEGQSDESYGETHWGRPGCRGQCRIMLDAEMIFLVDARGHPSTLRLMLSTLLHEMCHAFEHIRCAYRFIEGDGHDDHFGTRINCLHRRAMAILGGVPALDEGEGYVQHHFYVGEHAGCHKEAGWRRPVESLLRRMTGRRSAAR